MANRFIDFALVKKEVPFADAIELLDLRLKFAGNQWRGPCPACGGGMLVVTQGVAFHCKLSDVGGDQIALTKHILDLSSMRDAAFELAERAGLTTGTSNSKSTRSTVPESGRGQRSQTPRGGGKPPPQPSAAFDPVRYLAGLDCEHELLSELGADLGKMRSYGIGYSSRGTHKGMLAFRVYDPESGDEQFISVDSEGRLHLPATLKNNVVPLKKRA